MKNKFLIPYILSLFCIIFGAQNTKAERTNLDNFYVGGHFGYIINDAKVRFQGAREYGGSNNTKLAGHRVNGGIHLGFGCFHGKNVPLYLGMELIADLTNMQTKQNRTILDTPNAGLIELKQKQSMGAAVRIGTYLAKVMPYIKIGYVNGRWEFRSTLQPTGDPTANPSAKAKKSLPGLLLAVGVDIPLNEKIVVGLEGTHCHYKKFNVTHLNASPLERIKHFHHRIKPQTNILQLRLSVRL